MAVKEVKSEDEIFEEPAVKAGLKVRSKVKGTSTRLVLKEDDEDEDNDVEHSGIVDNAGNNVYDESRVAGGRIVKVNPRTGAEIYVNAKGQEINEETGDVLNPEKYKDDYVLGQ